MKLRIINGFANYFDLKQFNVTNPKLIKNNGSETNPSLAYFPIRNFKNGKQNQDKLSVERHQHLQ